MTQDDGGAAKAGKASPAELDDLLRLLGTLVRRPKRGELPTSEPGDAPGTRRGLPLICMVRPREQRGQVRERLEAWLHAGSTDHDSPRAREIPHTVVAPDVGARGDQPSNDDVIRRPAKSDEIERVRTLLVDLANGLRHEQWHGGRIPFRCFDLLQWLMDQRFPAVRSDDTKPAPAGDSGRYDWLRARLFERDMGRRRLAARDAVADAVPDSTWGRPMRAMVLWLPALWLAMRRAWRIPLIGGRYRWLRNQKYLAPHDPGSFIGFADRLTADKVRAQDPDQVVRLLGYAFLEDLRRAFGHRHWPWRWRGARRMAYVVAVVDGISRANGGYRLLRVINDVRNETARFDPLLLVSLSEMVPPHAHPPVPTAESAATSYRNWRQSFVDDSRSGKPNAWYLCFTVTGLGQPVGRGQPGRAPWWSSRWTAALLVLALLGLLVAVPGVSLLRWRGAHCGVGPSAAAGLLRTAGGECVGVTDGAYPFAVGNAEMSAVERVIRRQNDEALRDHRLQPSRPYAQLVFVAALTSTSIPPDPLVSEREALEGVAALQNRQLNDRGAADPIMRVLIANGGDRMRHGRSVAAIIRRMAARDHSIVGVVGFDQSRQQVTRTVRTLNAAGLPMVAATLSADALTSASPLYFTVAPQNPREARVAAAFAPELLGRGEHRVRVLHATDATDIYTSSLADDAVTAFRHKGFTVRRDDFDPRDVTGAGSRTCGFGGLVFYAGRANEFSGFLRGINQHCRSDPPTILASDDVSRYVADAYQRNLYTSIPFDYVSFAVGSPTCDTSSGPSEDVYATVKRLFGFECRPSSGHVDNDPSLDGHALLAYDATWCLTVAVQNLAAAGIPISAGAVWRDLSDLRLDGQSGRIDFGVGPNPQVSPDKAIAILRVEHGAVRTTRYRCGLLPGGISPDSRCPTDPDEHSSGADR